MLAVAGITNKSLRALMIGLLGGANYTGDGLRFTIFYTKLHDRLLRPLLATDQPPASPSLRKALHP